jgi:hypothetical protein
MSLLARPCHVPRILLSLAALALLVSCGESESTPLSSPGLIAAFTADQPSPAPGSVTLQPGSLSFSRFQVRVTFTSVQDVFSASFRIKLDPNLVAFETYDTSGSFLLGDGVTTDFIVDPISSPGELIVGASRRQDVNGSVPGVNASGTQNLIVFSFRARNVARKSPITIDTPRVVYDSSQPAPGNVIPVTWAGGTVSAAL